MRASAPDGAGGRVTMRQFLVVMAGVFAALILFFVGLPFLLIVALASAARPAAAPASTVLALDLRQAITDQDPTSPFAAFTGSRRLSVMGITATLRRAAADGRVKGLLIRLPEGGIAPAAADEIRDALKGFRASGKPVIAHSQGIYPSGMPVSSYMLGAASGAFWMQPGASLQATGAASSDLFFKRAFDKYGVAADYQQRYEYKNAVNPFLYDDYTPAHRESELGYMGAIYAAETAAAAADRKTDPAALRATLEAGPYLAEDALARRLIDHVGQEAEAEAALKAQAGDDAQLTDFAAYGASAPAVAGGASGPAVALISAEGAIQTGTSKGEGFQSSAGVYSDDVARAFSDAAADRDVKAIVFRVSSPGGSDTASEQILSGLRAAQAAHKPVVVSMGTYAASGGYWISSLADEIVAQPTTLTGSIGVFGGKFVVGPALARFGIDARSLSVGGPYADAFDTGKPFTPAQRAAFAGWMDRIYAGFVGRVAQGRRLSPDRVREIAKGRVWTGVEAQKLGLVDKLGGLDLALAEARRLGGLPGSGPLTVKRFPGRTTPVEALARMFGATGATGQAMASAAAAMDDPQLRSALALVQRARLQASGQALALAPLPLP